MRLTGPQRSPGTAWIWTASGYSRRGAPPMGRPFRNSGKSAMAMKAAGDPVTIGVIRDRAFQFYYPENIEALAARGARILEISAISDNALPPIDALYIGGGFPETQAAAPGSKRGLPPFAAGCGGRGPADLCRMRRLHVPGGIPDCRGSALSHGRLSARHLRDGKAAPGARLHRLWRLSGKTPFSPSGRS